MSKSSLSALKKKDAEVSAALQQYKDDTISAIRKHGAADGVHELGCGCFTITLGKFLPGLNLDPNTYGAVQQANAVQKKIAACKTVSDTVDAITKMVSAKKVEFPKGGSVTLNPNTIKVLEKFLED